MLVGSQKIIVIGASTGGVAALEELLSGFHAAMPPILIVQHMPPNFTHLFAEKLNTELKLTVKEAESGDRLVPGRVLIAPGGKHMKLVKRGANLCVDCYHGERVQFVMPSADVLFDTVADLVGKNAIGAILTGIGGDGAKGLLKMRNTGARTIGQDKESCEIYGMPKAAFEIGAVEFVLPLNRIANKIMSLI